MYIIFILEPTYFTIINNFKIFLKSRKSIIKLNSLLNQVFNRTLKQQPYFQTFKTLSHYSIALN